MANANIDALYVGSLRIKYHISFPSCFTLYKWCVAKVAHCTLVRGWVLTAKKILYLCYY